MADRYPRISSFREVSKFRAHVEQLGLDLPCDEKILTAETSSLSRSLDVDGRTVGNRFAIQPMEGWDGTPEGMPTELCRRRWTNFGRSGAKLIWGGEAFAVCPEGRANPNQLMASESTRLGLADLRQSLLDAHSEQFGNTDDLLLGIQLTHSGRFCRPNGKRLEPVILYRHPVLDRKFSLDPEHPVATDDYIRKLIERYIEAARIGRDVGFDFVDIKHCHGYLGHEFLSAYERPGEFGGSLENRTRFCREIVEGIRARAPDLMLGVRLSAFDLIPFRPDPEIQEERKLGPGIPEKFDTDLSYRFGFGVLRDDPTQIDLGEAYEFIAILIKMGINLFNITAGSPYYTPHIQRPALFPPSDGYQPPEDPLVGVARQLTATAQIKERFPKAVIVGSGYSYLQEFLPHVAQAAVAGEMVDAVGLGRMVLSYPELPADVLERGALNRRRICRTFSDCTTAPRNHLVSGCYPLDPFYKEMDEASELKRIKAGK